MTLAHKVLSLAMFFSSWVQADLVIQQGVYFAPVDEAFPISDGEVIRDNDGTGSFIQATSTDSQITVKWFRERRDAISPIYNAAFLLDDPGWLLFRGELTFDGGPQTNFYSGSTPGLPGDLAKGSNGLPGEAIIIPPQLNGRPVPSFFVGYADFCFWELSGTAECSDDTFSGTLNYTVAEVPAPLVGDIDLDDRVGFSDFLILSHRFGDDIPWWQAGDLNHDHLIDFTDFLLLSDNFGSSRDPVLLPALDTVNLEVTSVESRRTNVVFVPEPGQMTSLLVALMFGLLFRSFCA